MAIHVKPALAASTATASDTEPSEGHSPTGGRPNSRSMALARPRQLLRRILRAAERRPWNGRIRMRRQIDIGIAQQRQNRVVERRGRELGLSAGGRRRVFGNHAPEDLELHLAKQALVRFVESPLLGHAAS